MADNIWTATVEGIAARGRANNGAEGDYQFLFDADFYFVITPEVIPTMYYLDQDNTIRSEVIE